MSTATLERPTEAPTIPAGVRRVLVTGAAGCVGSYLIEELLGRGYEVQAVDRPGLALAQEGRAGLYPHGVDLRDPVEAARCVRGVDAVIHAAAVVDLSKSFEELRDINLDAVRILYDAAAREGAKSFLFLSSGSIYKASGVGPARPVVESSPLEASSDYERTKLWAEEWLQSRPEGGPRVAILRPALIFGPRGRVLGAALATVPPLLGRFSRRVPALFGGPRTNWVHAEDVARAAVHLLEHPQPNGSVFNVANDEALSIGEVVTVAARAAGLEVAGFSLPVPPALLRLMAVGLQPPIVLDALNAVLGGLWRRSGAARGDLQPKLDREMLAYLEGDVVFDNSRLKATGFELRHPRFEPAWRSTVEWYRQAGWLPPAPKAKRPRKAFRFSETMAGTLVLEPKNGSGAKTRGFRFTVTASASSQRGFWLGGEPLQLEGFAEVEGLATRQPARGTLELAPLLRRELVYELEFPSDRGETLRYYGKKKIRHLRPLSSWTTLRGSLLQSGMPIGRAELRFDLKQLPSFLLSARPW